MLADAVLSGMQDGCDREPLAGARLAADPAERGRVTWLEYLGLVFVAVPWCSALIFHHYERKRNG
jgi:hypothetical protein